MLWDRIDRGNYEINTNRFTRAVLAANAREHGDDVGADALVTSRSGPRWNRTAPAATQGSLSGATSTSPWRTGPRLVDVAHPDVLVTKAVSDGTNLELVPRPGHGGGRTALGLERLVPGTTYAVSGALADTVTADPEGRAVLEIELTDRLEVRLQRFSR